jgi:hypothetical protein
MLLSELKKLINKEIVAMLKESGQNDGRKTFFTQSENIFDEKTKDNVEGFFKPSGYDVGDKKVFSTTLYQLKVKHRGDTFLWRKETWKLLADVGRHEFTAQRIK